MNGKEQIDEIRTMYHERSEINARAGASLDDAHNRAHQQVLNRYSGAVEADLVHADFLIAVRRNREVERLLLDRVDQEEDSVKIALVWEKLGMVQLARGAEQTALSSLESALSLRDTYRVRRMICLTLYSLGRIQDTVNQLYLTLSLYHRVDRELLMILADCHVKTGEYEDAIMAYHQVLMDDQHNMKAYEMLQQLKWKIEPGRRTDLAELPPQLPGQYVTLQSFGMDNNQRWPHWQEVIDRLALPVVQLACDQEYDNTITFSSGLSNRTLFRIMITSSLHLTEDLFSRRYAEVLELPAVIVGSRKSGAIFNTERITHLGLEGVTVDQLLDEARKLAPVCFQSKEQSLK